MVTIALVGRPSVGKSTLFNRIVGRRQAITDKQPGVTRDRLYAVAAWLNRSFELIDTGGLTMTDAPFQREIAFQVNVAVEEADLVVLVTDRSAGVVDDDRHVARLLKKARKDKVVVCANKSDKRLNEGELDDFATLGFGPPVPTSAEHGRGIGDLLDRVYGLLKDQLAGKNEKDAEEGLKLAIIGKPNVGKSTLVNALVGKQRAIVSPVQGTTRDATDTPFTRNKERFTIIDTAGIRRKGAIDQGVENYAVLRAHRALARCDIALMVIDASAPTDHQDLVVAGLAHEANLPTILVANKWDAVVKDERTMVAAERTIRANMPYLSWAPLVFLSAEKSERVDKLFAAIKDVQQQAVRQVSPKLLTEVIAKAMIANNPPRVGGKRLEAYSATQTASRIPTFTVYCNDPQLLHFSFARFLENEVRKAFGLDAVPITLYFRPYGRARSKK